MDTTAVYVDQGDLLEVRKKSGRSQSIHSSDEFGESRMSEGMQESGIL